MEKSKGLEYFSKDYSLRDKDDMRCVSLIPANGSEGEMTTGHIDVLKDHPHATEV